MKSLLFEESYLFLISFASKIIQTEICNQNKEDCNLLVSQADYMTSMHWSIMMQ